MYKVVDSTRELIAKLKNGSYITTTDGTAVGHKPPTDLELEAAERLEQLIQIIDDMYGDHYVDYLDWYSSEYYKALEMMKEWGMNSGTD